MSFQNQFNGYTLSNVVSLVVNLVFKPVSGWQLKIQACYRI